MLSIFKCDNCAVFLKEEIGRDFMGSYASGLHLRLSNVNNISAVLTDIQLKNIDGYIGSVILI